VPAAGGRAFLRLPDPLTLTLTLTLSRLVEDCD
jgi:hypothetical protein